MRMLRSTATLFTTRLLRCQELMPDPHFIFRVLVLTIEHNWVAEFGPRGEPLAALTEDEFLLVKA